ncbi:MAG: integrin [Gammaproteobacteria bacterium]|nr:integrin [Gammaproteobacteria bacterium]
MPALIFLAAAFILSACVEQTIPIGGIPDEDEGAGATVPPPPGQLLFAGYGLKTLSFIWAKVEQTSFYRILEQAGPGSGFTVVSGEIDGIGNGPFRYTASLPLHSTDWRNTKFMFEACNDEGCTGSDDTLDVSPSDSVSMIGYMKPFDPVAAGQFGYSLAYSADGVTLAVGACPQGVVPDTGSVYIYTHDGADWTQQAKLKGSREAGNYGFGCSLAISSTGDVLAIGAIGDASSLTGIDPDGEDTAAPSSGAVYVFRRTDGIWAEESYIKASNTGANDGFGRALALTADGGILVVGAQSEDGNAVGGEADNSATDSGAVYVFFRDESGWDQQTYLKAPNVGSGDRFGAAVALSDNGATLAVGAPLEDSAGSGANDDCGSAQGEDNCLTDSGGAYIFTRTTGDWSQQDFIKAQVPGQEDNFGSSLDLSGDGDVLAVGAPLEDSAATGVGGDPVNDCAAAAEDRTNCSFNSGAAYLFGRSGTSWSQEAYIKASNTEAGECNVFPSSCDIFGTAIALSGDGSILAVGAPLEDSFTSGVNVPPISESRKNSNRNSGAVYIYRDQAFISIVKASAGERPTTEDNFGGAFALSADGASLAVGAIGDDCPFTGEEGNPAYSGLTNDNMQPNLSLCGTPADSGSVYLY